MGDPIKHFMSDPSVNLFLGLNVMLQLSSHRRACLFTHIIFLIHWLCNLHLHPSASRLSAWCPVSPGTTGFICFWCNMLSLFLIEKPGREDQCGVVSWGEDQSGRNISSSQARLDRLCWGRHCWSKEHIFSWGWWFLALTILKLSIPYIFFFVIFFAIMYFLMRKRMRSLLVKREKKKNGW